jgi:hypothetical protein
MAKDVSRRRNPSIESNRANGENSDPKRKILISKDKKDVTRLDRLKLYYDLQKLRFDRQKFYDESHSRRSIVTNQYAVEAIKSVLIINGAACVALVSFAGAAFSKSSYKLFKPLVMGAQIFAVGVSFAVAAFVFAYFVRAGQKNSQERSRKAQICLYLSVFCAIAALVCFPSGALFVASKLLKALPFIQGAP